MTESIGTARLDIVVDTSSLDAGVNKAKASTQDMARSAKDASASMEQNSKRQVASLEKQIATLGKSKEEIIRWRIEQQTSGKVAADLAAKLEQQVKHINAGGKAFNQFGLSAKQTTAALRGVPAQLTDIVTALSSGQRPLTVLIQQGGQLKDMFGGIVPAARALGGAIAGLINPYTLAAAAVVGLGVAFHEAENESVAFNKALLVSGNNAGLTVKQLHAMAAEIGATTSASSIGASDVLAKVAATGRFTADQIGLVSKAAINMQVVSGQAIEETIQQFVQLQNDPLDAILKLNESQHFLTESTVRQIEEFKKQGREADAAALAIKAWADTINTRAPQAEESLSGFSKILRSIKEAAADDAAAIVGMFNAAESGMAGFVARHEQLINKLKQFSQYVPLFGGTFATLDPQKFDATKPARDPLFANVRSGSDTVVDSRQERARIAAEEEFGKIRSSHLSEAKKLEQEITHIREVGAKAGVKQSEIEAQVAAARAAAAVKTGGGGGGGGRSRSGGGSVRALPDFNKNAAEDALRLAQAEDQATQAFLDQQAALDGPLAQAEREHAKRVEELNKLAAASPVASAGLQDALRKEAQAHQQNIEAIKAEMDPLGQLLGDMRAELDLIGKSNAERAVMIELRRQHIDVMSQEGQAALAMARTFEVEADAKQRSIDLMDRFRSGAADALTDFVTGAKSAKDALKDFFDEMARQITQAIADQWIKKLFGAQGTSGQGTSGEGIFGAILSMFGGGWGGIAKGKAFDQPVTAFANGGVVDRTTGFMSGGRLGIMGEAGPEAIVPLHRGKDGKLGIRMEAANDDRRSGPTVVNQTVVVQGRIDSRTPGQFAQATAREQNRASTRNR